MQWATYYGGTGYDYGNDVTTDGINIYLYGSTNSLSAISTAATFQTAIAGGGDCFVVKFLSTGVRSWGTYIGGSSGESAGGITCDALGNVLFSGTTSSTNFPIGFSGANVVYKNTLSSPSGDAFVFKLNPLCVRLFMGYLFWWAGLRKWYINSS